MYMYNMDIRNILKLHMNHIVGCFFTNLDGNEDKIMDEMYTLIENDININFDSKHFYFLKYELLESTKLKFKIDLDKTPKELLKMIINLIELQRMEQNIKNKAFLIHFRGFRDKVYLEDKDNTLRIEAFLQLHNYLQHPFTTIRIFLINKLLEIKNQIKNTVTDDTLYVSYRIREYRIRSVLDAIQKRTSLLC